MPEEAPSISGVTGSSCAASDSFDDYPPKGQPSKTIGLEALVEALVGVMGRRHSHAIPTASAAAPDPQLTGIEGTGPGQSSLEGETAGDRVGHYLLLEKIGEGGMGSVWRAEQCEPVHRFVALKIIKVGMDTREVVARFAVERQALAMMDHPNIAHAYDGGATATGRPYFVMELVEGIPITRFCDQARLTTRKRLKLFLRVCDAIQHAHQKGVIHRDIKPGNVLVGGFGANAVPKVIDFGIAKATGMKLSEHTLFTQHGQILGTPAYMSPEQAELSRRDIDTRSDIYGLGVLLYELLTGTTPFSNAELSRVAIDERCRILREVVPPKPSTKLRSLGEKLPVVAFERSTDAGKLGRGLRGELDWIVMKALQKDPERRYPTASALREDIGKYLENRPVDAVPPSMFYPLRKAALRHWKALAAAAAAVGILTATSGVALSERARNRAMQREAEVMMEFFKELERRIDKRFGVQGIVECIPPMIDLYEEMRASNKLVPSRSSRLFYAGLMGKLGSSYLAQGDLKRARIEYDRTLAERLALYREYPNDEDVVSHLSGAYFSLGKVAYRERDFESAVEYFDATLALNRKCLVLEPEMVKYRNNVAATMTRLGNSHHALGHEEIARDFYTRAVEIRRAIAAGGALTSQYKEDMVSSLTAFTHYLLDMGQCTEETEPAIHEMMEISLRRHEEEPQNLKRTNRLADVLLLKGRWQFESERPKEATETLLEVKDYWIQLCRTDPTDLDFGLNLARTRLLIARSALRQGIIPESVSHLEEFRSGEFSSPRSFEEDPLLEVLFHLTMAGCLSRQERTAAAARISFCNARNALDVFRHELPHQPRTLQVLEAELQELEASLR